MLLDPNNPEAWWNNPTYTHIPADPSTTASLITGVPWCSFEGRDTGDEEDASLITVRQSDCPVCERDRLRSQLDSLHTRLRALAADLGAVATDDPVEDVRRVVEGMREVVSAAKAQAKAAKDGAGLNYWECAAWIAATGETETAARRLGAERKGTQ